MSGGAGSDVVDVRSALHPTAMSAALLAPLHVVRQKALDVVFGAFGVEREVVLCSGLFASGVVQAGNEERGQNVNYCPPPSTPFTACAHLLYARTPTACSCCGCLF